ncbi:MAG TPA: LptA/OstA family protein [Candidatus Polarisedimenticolia bacterium]|nr:LptA/OstA family protein [Candidatus Polarisedimenticolia bacterium]
MKRPDHVHFGTQRFILALRALVLVILAALIVGMALTYGRRDRPQTQITMSGSSTALAREEGAVLDQSERFEVNGTRGGRPAFTLNAGTVTGFADERKLLEQVEMAIFEESGGSIQLLGSEGQFDPTARQAQLTGDVDIATPDGLSLQTGTLFYDSDRDMIFTGDAIRFSLGWMTGTGRGLNYLVGERQVKIPDQVELHMRGEDDIPITVTSGDLVASMDDNTAVFTDGVRLERGGDVLTGNYLHLRFDEERRHVTGIEAFGDVRAELASGPDGRPNELQADSLVVRLLTPSETIDRAEASGNCRFTSGAYSTQSRTALFLRQDDRLELRGNPVLLTDRDRIAAQEIDLRPDRQTLEARGDVRTVSLPTPGEGADTPGFGKGAVSFQANEMRADQAAMRAVYIGSARAWQGGNSLQAAEIIVDHAARQVRAEGKVISRWTTLSSSPDETALRPAVTMITSRSMVLDERGGTGRYDGEVRMTRPDATLSADLLDTFMSSVGSRRDVERIEASGSVQVQWGGSTATAQTAQLLNDESILILRDDDGLAQVVDNATGRSLRGRTLTYDLAGDRILTESERGGRTWITLDPESKDAPSVEPKTRH